MFRHFPFRRQAQATSLFFAILRLIDKKTALVIISDNGLLWA